MNEEILANRVVHTDVMDLDQALSTGAMALFGEKYGEQVRVVSIAELQQGTVRRHARVAHRRYRALQDRLRGQHLGGSPAHRSDHRRSGAAQFQSTRAQLAGVAELVRASRGDCSSRWKSSWPSRRRSNSEIAAAQEQAGAGAGGRSGKPGARDQGRQGAGRARRRLGSRSRCGRWWIRCVTSGRPRWSCWHRGGFQCFDRLAASPRT